MVLVHAHKRHALDGAGCAVRCPAAGRRHPWPGHCAQPQSVRSPNLAYGFIYKMVEDVTGKDGLKYFPYIMTLFIFHRLLELPWPSADGLHHHQPHRRDRRYGDGVFLSVTILGFVKNGCWFPQRVLDSAAPLVLRPILALIEVISTSCVPSATPFVWQAT